MSQSGNNLRVRRTQKLLREALIELIEEQGFDVLTVGELTGRAMVSRAAFYRNYRDKYDLVEQIFEEAMQALFEAVSATRNRPFPSDLGQVLRAYCGIRTALSRPARSQGQSVVCIEDPRLAD